jgi:hypothetical protein
MTPLRQRFIEDLQLRNRSPRTIETYVYHVRELACYFKRSPEQLSDEQIHRYLLHLLQHKRVSWSWYNQAVAAMRFFYRVTYSSDRMVVRLPYGKPPKRLPVVRSPQQVALLLDTARDRTVQMVLRTIYATGLRISEALHLTAPQIDSRAIVRQFSLFGPDEGQGPLAVCSNSLFFLLYPVRWAWSGRGFRSASPTYHAGAMGFASGIALEQAALPPYPPTLSYFPRPFAPLLPVLRAAERVPPPEPIQPPRVHPRSAVRSGEPRFTVTPASALSQSPLPNSAFPTPNIPPSTWLRLPIERDRRSEKGSQATTLAARRPLSPSCDKN